MSHSWWLKQQSEYILHYVSQYPIPIYPHPSSTDNTLDLHFVFGGYVYTYMGVQLFVRYITLNPYQSFPLAHHKVLPVALHGDNDWTGWPFACGLGRRTGGCPRVKAVVHVWRRCQCWSIQLGLLPCKKLIDVENPWFPLWKQIVVGFPHRTVYGRHL